MDFQLSEEQQLLKDSVERFVRESYPFENRRKLAATELGWSRQHWRQMAELGWLGVAVPEAYGGSGGGPVEHMIIMEAIGRGLVLEPFFPTAVLGGELVAAGGSEAVRQAALPQLAAGELQVAFAFAEPQARFDLHDVATRAVAAGDSYRLNGHKAVVLGGPTADKLVVAARTAGERRDPHGVTLFLVDARAPGVGRRDYPTVDGLRASEVTLADVAVPASAVLGQADEGHALMLRAVDKGIAALCAEAVGCMQVLLDDTNDYLKQRVQFGQPIGKFQVLQHRMADMFMAVEEARSLCYMATLKLDDPQPGEAARAVAAAKVQVGRSGRFVGQQAVQLHGGMGMTEELHIGHYFKRLTMIDVMFGNADHHLKRFAQLS